MRGRRKSRVIVAAGLATLVFAAGCSGPGVEVPSATGSGPSSSSATPSEVSTAASPSTDGSSSPRQPATPSEFVTVPAEPPVPPVQGIDLSDPGWLGVAPPLVMEGLQRRGASLKPPEELVGGYKLKGHEKTGVGGLRITYRRDGDDGEVEISLREDVAFPPAGWGEVVKTMVNPRPIGASVCYEWIVGSPGCIAFAEDLRFDVDYVGRPEDMPAEKLEVLLEDFIRTFGNA